MASPQSQPGDALARTRSITDSPDAYAHLDPVLSTFAALEDGDPRRAVLRGELVTGYLPVVHHIARRYRDHGEPVVDLHQVGTIGLLGAVERFDPGFGTNFLSFAVPTITGEIRRHFRDRTWSMRVPRRLKDLQGPVREAVSTLSASLERAPRPSEIAAHLDVPINQVVEAMSARHAYAATSLDAIVGREGSEVALGDVLGVIDTALTTAGYREGLRRALAELPERERSIVILRFFDDLTQTQIASRVGLSQMHVSRLLAQSLAFLRANLDS